jgi:PAS domain S-box-containing protein
METVYLNFVYEALHDEEGKINGIIAVATDVTEQVLARHKIEYAEESATLAIESGDLGTYEVNLLNDEMITSPRFKAIWGVDEQAPDRASLASMIHQDDLPVRDRAHKKANETGKLHYEARVLCNDGNYKWVKINGKVLFDEKHRPKRLLGVIQDITEQKTFAEELSKQVEDQTRDLIEANERLERSNEDLEQFAYVASHDLQEPLRKIKFFNSLVLENEDLADESRRYIEKVSHAAERMAGLIRDLLESSRLSQKNFQFERTDLNVIFNNILSDFELLISQKNGKVEAGMLPTLDAIPLQMNQLFYNLIGNALKFSKRGVPPIIKVSANKLTSERIKGFPELNIENEYFEIKFSDNGMGFNQQYADKIFTIFQRLNEKSVYGGYGIGLALCRKIINNHSGIIYAEGRPGEGATFIFILPCKQL